MEPVEEAEVIVNNVIVKNIDRLCVRVEELEKENERLKDVNANQKSRIKYLENRNLYQRIFNL